MFEIGFLDGGLAHETLEILAGVVFMLDFRNHERNIVVEVDELTKFAYGDKIAVVTTFNLIILRSTHLTRSWRVLPRLIKYWLIGLNYRNKHFVDYYFVFLSVSSETGEEHFLKVILAH